jgi:hypothetical protein
VQKGERHRIIANGLVEAAYIFVIALNAARAIGDTLIVHREIAGYAVSSRRIDYHGVPGKLARKERRQKALVLVNLAAQESRPASFHTNMSP